MKIDIAIKELANGNIGILDQLNKEEIRQVLNFIKESAIKESKEKIEELKKYSNQNGARKI